MITRILGAAACCLLLGCSKTTPEASTPQGATNVAIINGTAIPEKDYVEYLKRKRVVQIQTPGGIQEAEVTSSVGMQALRDIVNRQILLQMAEKEGVMPTKEDIDKELEFKLKLRSDYVSFLSEQGLTTEMIRDDLKFDLAKERLQTKGITVTLAEAEEFIKKNPAQFSTPAQAQMFYILAKSEARKSEVDAKLASGAKFEEVANALTEAPGAKEFRSAYPVVEIQRMPPRLRDLVNKTAVGKATEWQKDGTAWVKFFVAAKRGAMASTISDVQKEFVRRQLALEKGERESGLAQKLTDQLKASKIEVQDSYLKGPWDRAYAIAKSATPVK